MKRFTNQNKIPLSLDEIMKNDPLQVFSLVLLLILVLVGVQTWAYSKKDFFISCWKFITRTNLDPISNLVTNENQGMKNNKFEETKNVIIGSSGALITTLLIILLLTPTLISKSIVRNDPNNINSGSGRLWSYASRISIPILGYCVMPIIIIAYNSKMRKTLRREIQGLFK